MILKITNFQSHSDSTLDIKPNAINVIVGESDSGKSSIIRAIELLALNRPSGDKYRTHDTKKTEVSWKGVTRTKTASTSKYEVDGEEFKALRTDVPRQVTDKLRISELNFRDQHSPYYMLTETPGQRARAMNDLADLGLIDYTASAIKAISRENNSSIVHKESDLAEKNKQIESLAWAKKADTELATIENLLASIETLELELNTTLYLVAKLEGIEDKLNSFPESWADVLTIETLQERLNSLNIIELESRVNKLAEYEEDLRVCPDPSDDIDILNAIIIPDYSRLESVCNKLGEIENKQWPDDDWVKELMEVEVMFESVKDLETKAAGFAALMEKFKKINEAYVSKVLDEQEAIDKYNEALRELEVCPLCGGSTCE